MRRAVVLAAALALATPAATAADSGVTVFAAASLSGVFPRIDRAARYSFAGSDQLALQIRQGAPADVFAAANAKLPDQLYAERILLKPAVFATNRLVVIVPRANPGKIVDVYDLRRRGLRLVIGDASVPIGAYARAALHSLGLDDALGNVVSEEVDVKGIVAKVRTGEADAGIVYSTDARSAGTRVRALPVPGWAQPSIRYELAVVAASSKRAAAQAFVRRVLGKAGRAQLVRAGFGVPSLR